MRVALITGGTRGIGAAISIKLKETGYKVAAIYAGNNEAATKFSMDNKIDILFYPCKHALCCNTCYKKLLPSQSTLACTLCKKKVDFVLDFIL